MPYTPAVESSWPATSRRISSSVSAINVAASRTGCIVVIRGHGSRIPPNVHPRSSLLRRWRRAVAVAEAAPVGDGWLSARRRQGGGADAGSGDATGPASDGWYAG